MKNHIADWRREVRADVLRTAAALLESAAGSAETFDDKPRHREEARTLAKSMRERAARLLAGRQP